MDVEHKNLDDCLNQYFAELDRIESEPNPLIGSLSFGEALDVYLDRATRLSSLIDAIVARTKIELQWRPYYE